MSGICFVIAVQYWEVIWTMEAWVTTLGYVGQLCVVFAILWRSSTLSEYSLASLHGCFTCRGRRQVILNCNPGPSRMLQYRVASSTRWTLSSLTGSFAGPAVVWKEVLPFHHWVIRTMEAWVMNWVIWDIYECYLLFHGGAVLRGGRKPMVELPNVTVQTAWWFPSSTSGSITGPQWNGRSFFQVHHWVIWTNEAWGMTSGYVGHLWVIFAISLRSCTERWTALKICLRSSIEPYVTSS